jgi:Protein of unknown function DUF104
MGLQVEATFENGVFVPEKQPHFSDRTRVRLTIERASGTNASDAVAAPTSLRRDRDTAAALGYHPDGC